MRTQRRYTTRLRSAPAGARAFTLTELLLSVAIAGVLLTGLGSAVLIASHALPEQNTTTQALLEASELVDQMVGELNCALAFTERSGTSVEFTVPDRNADLAAETIRYAWAGAPGDPLTRRYNGGTVVTVSEEVQDFSLAYSVEAGPPPESPTVLFVDRDPSGPVKNGPRKAAMESWGFQVQLIADSAPDAAFATAMTTCDVAYVSEKIISSNIGTRLRDAPIGIVNEELYLNDEFGFSSNTDSVDYDRIEVIDSTHEITSAFATGILTICSWYEPLYKSTGTMAGGARVLARSPVTAGPMLMTIEVGGALYAGGEAEARRVKLPWGGSGFDFNSVNSDGLEIMRRAIEWASAPSTCAAVHIVLQVTEDSAGRVETQIQILNRPEVKGS